jgi:eukaryotic-like serine/threonine-protein kinase
VSSAPPLTFAPGLQLYKYQLLNLIGTGGFGEVWLARDAALNREFAVKILRPGMTVDARLREAQIGNRLTHNNLVHVHQADVVDHGGAEFVMLAMDFHAAGSVERLVNPAGFIPLPDVLRIGRDILQGLDHLHSKNFFHNDIKPGNVLIGSHRQFLLSDYGITGVSPDGQPVPAPNAYLFHRAPEVRATNTVSVSSDIFQVGMTLARLLIGLTHLSSIWMRDGQTGYETKVDAGKLLTAADFPSHIPAPVKRVILRSINPDPAARYATSLDMRRDLERLSYPGFWTVDASGDEIGHDANCQYGISLQALSGDSFNLECSRTRSASGRKQRVSEFCRKGVTRREAQKAIDAFKQMVVTGK